nr:hypothetical protein [Tanacetum cinerariifolium]
MTLIVKRRTLWESVIFKVIRLFMDNDVESVADIMDDIKNFQTNVVDDHDQVFEAKVQECAIKDPLDILGLNELPNDSDPFGLDSLIKKKSGKVTNLISSKTHVFPLGFTPTTTEETIKVGSALGLDTEGCENTLVMRVWEALGGNTHDLDSIWEETRRDCNFTRSDFKNACIVHGDGIAIPRDAV